MAPAKYIYNFTVDGITIADPANAQVKLRQQGQGSFFEVRGETPGVADIRDVPHGTIETVTRKSSVLGDTRSFLVYTPPGYEQERERRYPVLYLLHGHNDRPVGWVDVGHIHFIADNLIAEKKAVPMIIVLPPTHAVPIDSPAEVQRTNGAVFEEYLLKDVIPAVEAQYRIAAGRHQRAIAGFSMGGGIALRVFANHVDKFCAVGLFSTAQSRALQERADIFADAKAFNARVDAFYIGAGRQEPRFLTTSSELHTSLTKLGIHHTWRPADGYHHFALWRRHAIEFLPLLFNAAGPAATAARQDGKRGPKVK